MNQEEFKKKRDDRTSKMIEKRYRVLIDGVTVATGMSLEHATIFLKALFLEYYNEDTMAVAITRDNIEEDKNETINL